MNLEFYEENGYKHELDNLCDYLALICDSYPTRSKCKVRSAHVPYSNEHYGLGYTYLS
jgi:hypothetical protein